MLRQQMITEPLILQAGEKEGQTAEGDSYRGRKNPHTCPIVYSRTRDYGTRTSREENAALRAVMSVIGIFRQLRLAQ
jgi:hypothetical protein